MGGRTLIRGVHAWVRANGQAALRAMPYASSFRCATTVTVTVTVTAVPQRNKPVNPTLPRSPYWEACSFGTFKVNPTNFRVISVTIGCSSATMVSACDWESMGKLADTAAQAQLGASE